MCFTLCETVITDTFSPCFALVGTLAAQIFKFTLQGFGQNRLVFPFGMIGSILPRFLNQPDKRELAARNEIDQQIN